MMTLGAAYLEAGLFEDARPVLEAQLGLLLKHWPVGLEAHVRVAQHNLANCYSGLGWSDQALRIERHVYAEELADRGPAHLETLRSANNLASSLIDSGRVDEARAFLDEEFGAARAALGLDHQLGFKLANNYARVRRADAPSTKRGDAAAWIVRGDESRRRRGWDVDVPWRRVACGCDADIPRRLFRGDESRDAAAGTRIFRGETSRLWL